MGAPCWYLWTQIVFGVNWSFIPSEQAKVPEKEVWPIEEIVYSIVFVHLALVDLIKSLGIEYTYAIGHR